MGIPFHNLKNVAKKTAKACLVVFLSLAFFLSNIPFGAISFMADKWNEKNIVDLMWQSQNKSSVVDSFRSNTAEAAEVTIESDLTDATDEFGPSPAVVFTTNQIGYTVFIDSGNDLAYRKTINGGTNWQTPVVIDNTKTGWTNVSVWYDQWTPGDSSNTLIHIAASDDTTDDIYYTYLDTNGDSLRGSVTAALLGATFTEAANAAPSITKGQGGNLFIAANFASISGSAGGLVARSTDGGASWPDVTPSVWSTVSIDQIQLLPLKTGNDIIAIKAETSSDAIKYRIYTEGSPGSWADSWSSIAALKENTTYDQWFSATIKKSTGDVYLAFSNNTNNEENDIEFWSFDESDRGSGFVKGTNNIISNDATAIAPVPLIDENSGDIYVAYIAGRSSYMYPYLGLGLSDTAHIYYKKTTDGGQNWSSETGTHNNDYGDDYRSLSGNLLSENRLFVSYYDDDDNDILGTTVFSQGIQVEASIDTTITDSTDEYGPSPSGVFIDGDVGYQFFVKTNIINDATDEFGPSPTTVFTDANNGYTFYIDSNNAELVYKKTINGGTNWSPPTIIDNTKTGWTNVSVWYDQWTPGDTTGVRIHIAAADDIVDDVFYTYLDTDDDTLKGSMVAVIQQSAFTETENAAPGITKGAGGALFVTANFATTAGGYVYRSADGAGDSWSDITPSGWSSASRDQVQLLPLLTNNDIVAIRADTANNDMDYQIYTEGSPGSWAGSWTTIASMVDNTTYDQWFSATIKKSTGDVYLVFTNNISVATGDIEFWTLTDSGRTFVKSSANVVDNLATILTPVPYYETDTGTIYVAYARGTLGSTMHVYFKSTSDGGTTWSSESSALSYTSDDHKFIRGNMMHSDVLYTAWYNDDLNSISGDNILSNRTYEDWITGQNVVYRKTTNGGGAWGAPRAITSVGGGVAVAVWYDQWTPGDDTNTKIHIAFSDDWTDDYYYTYLDTSDDSMLFPAKPVLLGTGITEASVGVPSITKGAGGNLFISGNFNTTAGGQVAISTDNGDNWTDATPGSWSSVAIDQIQLLPLKTGNDIIAIKAETGSNAIKYQVYTEGSPGSWAGSWSSIAALTENTTYDQWFSATIKKSTGDVYLAFSNNTNNEENDIEFWSFDESDRGSGFVKGTNNIISNDATSMMPVPLIDENSGDIYVAYLRGTLASATRVYYKKSTDGGNNWSGESETLSPGIVDAVYALKGNLLSAERLYVFWYNNDLNDIYGNTVIEPAPPLSTAIEIRAQNYTTSVSSITFPPGASGSTVSGPYNDIDGSGSPQTFGSAGVAKPVVTLYNGGASALIIWYNIATFTNSVVSNEYYLVNAKGGACADAGCITETATFDADVATGTTIAAGAGNEKDLYLKAALGAMSGESGNSTITILGEAE
ncbi:MAG TPA: hypothetical protein P5080_02885 [Candidatus Paceibacterota bacterium]|nr:hypothetical protein [Candidatus Paceibacterota bacterium]